MSARPMTQAESLHRVQWLLREICSVADTMRAFAPNLVDHVSAVQAPREADPVALRDAAAVGRLAGQLGWMADHALQLLGDPGVVGGPDQWMLPAAYHDEPEAGDVRAGGDHA